MDDTGFSSDASLSTVLKDTATPDIDIEAKTRLFDLLSRAHTIPILHAFAISSDAYRFNELEDRLDVPPTTLTDRLRELTDADFLTRRSYDEIQPRVEYAATEKTVALKPMFEFLCAWAVHYRHD